jgi:hypothetical protein
MTKVGDILNEMFANTKISAQLKARELDYNFMQKIIRDVTPQNFPDKYAEGYRYYMKRNRRITGNISEKPIFKKTKAEFTEDTIGPDGKVIKSIFKQYVDLLNKVKANRFSNFAADLKDVMSRRSLDDFEEVVMSISPKYRNTLMHHFRRYIECN